VYLQSEISCHVMRPGHGGMFSGWRRMSSILFSSAAPAVHDVSSELVSTFTALDAQCSSTIILLDYLLLLFGICFILYGRPGFYCCCYHMNRGHMVKICSHASKSHNITCGTGLQGIRIGECMISSFCVLLCCFFNVNKNFFAIVTSG